MFYYYPNPGDSYYQPGFQSPPYPNHAWTISRLYYSNTAELREKQEPITFVLIHGSWADSSFWNGVAAFLRKKGHTVYAPEYAGHGADTTKNANHAMMTQSIVDFIEGNNLNQVVLVGHSFGGTLVQTVAQAVPDRIKRLVFFDAFILNDGEMLAEEFPPPVQAAFESLIQSSKDNSIMLPFPLFRENFTNLASLQQAQQFYRNVKPEPATPFHEKLDLKKFYSLTIPRSYLYLTEDNVLPFGSSQYGWHPHMSNRLGMYRFLQDSGDHFSTTLLDPGKIARRLYEAGRD
ncbi:alpha/beta fold hydrolase [Paenibacillus solisilvae]|uniref:Alpha/beta fold hydrolase n=1 Tax=Paenibacillus solisilvae TaxID=2486751 RepID=A0ABW0VWF1_9BACL